MFFHDGIQGRLHCDGYGGAIMYKPFNCKFKIEVQFSGRGKDKI